MKPKCPWCGDEIITRKTDGHWTHECANNCYSSCWYSTESEALAAASKRFMPKRSVEEIEEFVDNACDYVTDKIYEHGLETRGYYSAIFATRIADYMTGVTE